MAELVKATKRNPIMQLVIVLAAMVGASIVGSIVAGILGSALVANVFSLAGYGVFAFIMIGMVTELKKVGGNDLAPWMVAVPLLNLWFLFMKVPEAMNQAKLKAGAKNPTKAGWMYLLFSPYALSADLNDLA